MEKCDVTEALVSIQLMLFTVYLLSEMESLCRNSSEIFYRIEYWLDCLESEYFTHWFVYLRIVYFTSTDFDITFPGI